MSIITKKTAAACCLAIAVGFAADANAGQLFPPESASSSDDQVLLWKGAPDNKVVSVPQSSIKINTAECPAGQFMVKITGGAVKCLPTITTPPTCTGDKALQWDGTKWLCNEIGAPATASDTVLSVSRAPNDDPTNTIYHKPWCPSGYGLKSYIRVSSYDNWTTVGLCQQGYSGAAVYIEPGLRGCNDSYYNSTTGKCSPYISPSNQYEVTYK